MRHHVPNLITVSNLFCGVLAILALLKGDAALVAILIGTALLMDFLDGFVARKLQVTSPLGKELDSLADMVSFGLLPGIAMASMAGLSLTKWEGIEALSFVSLIGIFSALLIPIFSAVRLAKYNLDDRQSERFLGLPTPANGILITSLWFISQTQPDHWLSQALAQPWVVAILSLLLCYLLVAELPLLSLKFQDFSFFRNQSRYLLLAGSGLLLIWLREMAAPLIIFFYLGLSLIDRLIQRGT